MCQSCFTSFVLSSDSKTCDPCNAGKFGASPGVCTNCTVGRYENSQGSLKCKECARGQSQEQRGMIECNPCGVGTFANKTSLEQCYDCPKGYYMNDFGSASCFSCSPGKYAPEPKSLKCTNCPNGYLQEQQKSSSCYSVGAGQVVAKGGSSSIQVPLGSKICDAHGDGCNSVDPFEACTEGTYGKNPPTNQCLKCPAGLSSSRAATECPPWYVSVLFEVFFFHSQGCLTKFNSCNSSPTIIIPTHHSDKGKFNPSITGSPCEECAPGFFQDQNIKPSLTCKECPAGWGPNLDEDQIGISGSSVCRDLSGLKPSDCGDDEYWVPDKFPGKYEKSQAGCVDCPAGGSCVGAIGKEGIRALFGWSKCPNLNLTYALCAFGAACDGAKNELLEDKYVDEFGNDPATINRNASCSAFYKNNSLLCAACADGYSKGGGGHKCEKCPPPSENVLLAILGSLAGIIGLFVLTVMNLSDKGKVDPSDGAKSIGLSFVQVITLLTSFPIAWPQIFVNIFQVGGAVTTLGQHFVNFKCFYPERSEAEVFYSTSVVWAIMPVLLPLASAMVWLLLSKIKNVEDLQPKMKSTIVGLLYLIWPTLISTTFSLFSCSSVCGQTLLRIDLEEECWVGRHAFYGYALGIPMLLLFVFGFPMIAMVMVQRLQSTVRETKKSVAKAVSAAAGPGTSNGGNRGKGKHHRWFSNVHVVENITSAQMSTHEAFGMLYTSFREDVWWWEITVTVRKIVIVGIGVFGESMGEMQVHVTLLCIGELINC